MYGPSREVGMLTMGPACAVSSAVAVAVGGGGQNYDADDDGGSGSGYVEWVEFNVSAALMQFEAIVGSPNDIESTDASSQGMIYK